MLAAVGYWGFNSQPNWVLKILLGIGLPLLIAILWGTFLAPKATHPLRGASFLTLELVLFSLGALALFAADKPVLGWVYIFALIINKILLFVWKQ